MTDGKEAMPGNGPGSPDNGERKPRERRKEKHHTS